MASHFPCFLFLEGIWEKRSQKVRWEARVVLCYWRGREADCLKFRSEPESLTVVDHQW